MHNSDCKPWTECTVSFVENVDDFQRDFNLFGNLAVSCFRQNLRILSVTNSTILKFILRFLVHCTIVHHNIGIVHHNQFLC